MVVCSSGLGSAVAEGGTHAGFSPNLRQVHDEPMYGAYASCLSFQLIQLFHVLYDSSSECSFKFNSCFGGSGCAIWFLYSSSSFMISFTFNSSAGLSGGAIWFLCSGSCE